MKRRGEEWGRIDGKGGRGEENMKEELIETREKEKIKV